VLHWFGRRETAPFEDLMIGFAFLGAGFGLLLLLTPVLFTLARAGRTWDAAFVAVSLLVAQLAERIVKGAIAERRPAPADGELINGLSDVRRVVVVLVVVGLVAALATQWRRAALALAGILAGSLLLYEVLAPATLSAGDYGFPSGHATGSMTLAAAVVLLARRTRWATRTLVVAGLFVVGVGFSRLSFGVHYPTDVLGGWLLALAAVAGTRAVLPRPAHLNAT
jgi:membrane-associated phospholipid phosphatase